MTRPTFTTCNTFLTGRNVFYQYPTFQTAIKHATIGLADEIARLVATGMLAMEKLFQVAY
jgi:hypothetical protein